MTDTATSDFGLVRDLPKAARRDGFLVVLVMLIAVIVSVPVSKVILGDDSSYALTASVFAHTGHFAYNGWATASLGWQIL